ncbi:hypothetical protein HZB00_03220 [Candidatus Woesearchaeota archaeon]|nr:hypothetical protein [Candidatus Woesearchaeota archaeon]
MKKVIQTIFAFVAVIGGLFALFSLLPTRELAVGFLSLTFGVLAVIWTGMAFSSLARGSSLRSYTAKFLISLILVIVFSAISAVHDFFPANVVLLYAGYITIILAYIMFVMAAHDILKIGKEFGFGETAEEIRKVVEEKRKKTLKKK